MRPTKLTPETVSALCEALRAGAYLETASRAAGVAPSTLHGWLRRGKIAEEREELQADEVPFLELVEAVKKAQAVAELEALRVIREAAERGSWQAAAWFLERSNPAGWSRAVRPTIPDEQNWEKVNTSTDARETLMAKLGLMSERLAAAEHLGAV